MAADQNDLKEQPESDSGDHGADEPAVEIVGKTAEDQPESAASIEAERVKSSRAAQKKPEKAVFSINFYTWTTPIVGVVMLVIGLLAGYFGRPLLAREQDTTGASGANSVGTPSGVTDVEPPANNASPEEVMAFLTGNVRHFKGDESAPVTIIEFSDFQ